MWSRPHVDAVLETCASRASVPPRLRLETCLHWGSWKDGGEVQEENIMEKQLFSPTGEGYRGSHVMFTPGECAFLQRIACASVKRVFGSNANSKTVSWRVQANQERLEALHATVTSNRARTGSSVRLRLLNSPLKKQAMDKRRVFSYTWVPEGENATILSPLGLINLRDMTLRDGVFHHIPPRDKDTLSLNWK